VNDLDPVDDLSALFTFLADGDFHGYSPIYERLAGAVAEDRDILTFALEAAAPNSRRGRIPVLFFAATHDVVLSEPDGELAAIYRGDTVADPVPPFRRMLVDQRDGIVERMRSRSVQTNEVGRSATLVPAITGAVGDDRRPIALVEIGPSAGLNLFSDRYSIAYSRHGEIVTMTGPADSPVRLHSELRGPLDPPLPTSSPDIAVRTGVDANPIDVTDAEQCRWLRACLWPGVVERAERLAAALEMAARTPPTLVRGDAVTDLVPLVAALPSEFVPVITSTWALAYIPTDGRQRILDGLDALGATRDLMYVTLEEPRFTPWIPWPASEVAPLDDGDGTPTGLGLRVWRNGGCDTRPLALCHPHGRWIHWLDEGHR
jgi:hypothetical protein